MAVNGARDAIHAFNVHAWAAETRWLNTAKNAWEDTGILEAIWGTSEAQKKYKYGRLVVASKIEVKVVTDTNPEL